MSFDVNMLGSGVDERLSENDAPMYPVVQWANGSPAAKAVGGIAYAGGWFMSEDNAPFSEGGEKWSDHELVHRDGSSTKGFACEGVHFAVLHVRRRWEIYKDNGQRQAFPWNKYDEAKGWGNPRGRMHMLSMVKGLEEYGPFIVTMSGMSAAAMTKRGGILEKFGGSVVYAAKMMMHRQAMEKGVEPANPGRFMFYMPVASERNPKKWDEPVFSTVGRGQNTSQVTYPNLVGVPDDHEDVDLAKFFVGVDNRVAFQEKALETLGWAQEWDSFEGGEDVAKLDGYADQMPKEAVSEAVKGDSGDDGLDFMNSGPKEEEIPF